MHQALTMKMVQPTNHITSDLNCLSSWDYFAFYLTLPYKIQQIIITELTQQVVNIILLDKFMVY